MCLGIRGFMVPINLKYSLTTHKIQLNFYNVNIRRYTHYFQGRLICLKLILSIQCVSVNRKSSIQEKWTLAVNTYDITRN